jgi:CRISPR type I-E-associated protein CasB/Cse2
MSIEAIGHATQAPRRAQDPLWAIAAQLSSPRADRGMLAALRRFNPISDGRHNLFEVQQVLLTAGIDLPADHPRQPRWALVVHCLAIVRGAHRAQRDTGAGLAELGLSEARLRQLLEADGPLLVDLLPTLARRVAAAGVTLNWWPLAELILAGDDGLDRARKARLDIAQGFLRATAAKAGA